MRLVVLNIVLTEAAMLHCHVAMGAQSGQITFLLFTIPFFLFWK